MVGMVVIGCNSELFCNLLSRRDFLLPFNLGPFIRSKRNLSLIGIWEDLRTRSFHFPCYQNALQNPDIFVRLTLLLSWVKLFNLVRTIFYIL